MKHRTMPTPAILLFDLDDTLAEEVASAGRALLSACEIVRRSNGVDPRALRDAVRRNARKLWFAHPLHPYAKRTGIASWEALWARFEGDGPEIREYRAWSPLFRRSSWLEALLEFGIEDDELAAELSDTFIRTRREIHVVYDDVHDALGTLRNSGRYRMAVVTNGLSCLQREKFRGAGLERYFDAVIAGGDIGIGKPDPRIFRHLLDELDGTADETIMTGNSLEKDIAGARAAGIFSVWMDRSGTLETDGCEPDLRIENLFDLVSLLGHEIPDNR